MKIKLFIVMTVCGCIFCQNPTHLFAMDNDALSDSNTDFNPLPPCPDRPNCVVSEGPQNRAFIEPFVMHDSPQLSWKPLKEIILSMGGVIEKENNGYLACVFSSRIFRFKDDVMFRMDMKEGVIHVRSAARLGYYDFGVNRKRLEEIRQRLLSLH